MRKKTEMLEEEILELIDASFDADLRPAVIEDLASVTLQHVMAESACNLRNTRIAILKLSKGDLEDLRILVARAKIDFRDVIYWATEDDKRSPN